MAAASAQRSLRAIALFESAKGAIVLIAGAGLLQWAHRHAQHAADDLVRHLHLNPARSHPRIFEQAMQVTDRQLKWLALGALIYAGLRIAEAWGLWRQRPWAEWLALVSGGIYLPFELYEFLRHFHWAAGAMLAINLLIVTVMAKHIRDKRQQRV